VEEKIEPDVTYMSVRTKISIFAQIMIVRCVSRKHAHKEKISNLVVRGVENLNKILALLK
jgi:hypothetical protein